jgi:collagenase-like PrtC family protease
MKRSFSLPYTAGILNVIEQLPIEQISDIYFSDNKFGSARALDLDADMLAELYEIRNKHGIKLHYLINGNYYSNESYEKVHEIIEHIKALDVDILTMNNTYLMRDRQFIEIIRNCRPEGVEVKNSVNNLPRTLKDVVFLVEVLYMTHVVVDRALNRNLDELKKISDYCKEQNINITMLVNEGCIVDCMWKNVDDMMIAQTNKQSNMKVIQLVHNQLGCTDYFAQKPGEYLKTGFTLPNNLSKFDGLVDIIKLAGRGIPIEKWLTMCKSYMYESGNVTLKTLFSTRPPIQLMQVTANDLMDVNFNKITENCKNVCGTECTLCDDVATKLVPSLKKGEIL